MTTFLLVNLVFILAATSQGGANADAAAASYLFSSDVGVIRDAEVLCVSAPPTDEAECRRERQARLTALIYQIAVAAALKERHIVIEAERLAEVEAQVESTRSLAERATTEYRAAVTAVLEIMEGVPQGVVKDRAERSGIAWTAVEQRMRSVRSVEHARGILARDHMKEALAAARKSFMFDASVEALARSVTAEAKIKGVTFEEQARTMWADLIIKNRMTVQAHNFAMPDFEGVIYETREQ